MAAEYPIFIVDDDEAVKDSLVGLLQAHDYTVQGFSSAQEFLASVSPTRAGCLVLDVRLVDADGLELQERLNNLGYLLAIVIMTGHGDVPMAVKALKAGAVDFIEKPFSRDTIVAAIRRAFAALDQRMGDQRAVLDAEERLAQLTPREREVLLRLILGLPNKSIAFELNISPRTVEVHRARIMEKTKAESLPHLVRLGLAAGLRPNIS